MDPQPNDVPQPAAIAIGVIETDTFCDRCGFNLHTQRVWRDGRLGILVTRCPECGAHQAAGRSTTTASAWLKRLAMIGLVWWIGIALAFVVGVFFLNFGITVGSVEELVTDHYETLDGRPVDPEYDSKTGSYFWTVREGAASTRVPEDGVVKRFKLVPALTGQHEKHNTQYYYRSGIPLWGIVVMSAIFAAGLFLVGSILSAATWFWRRGWRWVWLLLPILAAVIVFAVAYSESQAIQNPYRMSAPREIGRNLYFSVGAVIVGLQVLVMGIGLWMGRPIARFVVSVIVPPKSRQLFAFLWHADGKAMRGPKQMESTMN